MAPSPNKFPLGGMGKEERGRLKSSQATLLLFVASIQIFPGMLFRYVKVYITGRNRAEKTLTQKRAIIMWCDTIPNEYLP